MPRGEALAGSRSDIVYRSTAAQKVNRCHSRVPVGHGNPFRTSNGKRLVSSHLPSYKRLLAFRNAKWIPAFAGMTLLVFALGAVIEFFCQGLGNHVADAIHQIVFQIRADLL